MNFHLYGRAQYLDNQLHQAFVDEYGSARAGTMRYYTQKLPPHIRQLAEEYQRAAEEWIMAARRTVTLMEDA